MLKQKLLTLEDFRLAMQKLIFFKNLWIHNHYFQAINDGYVSSTMMKKKMDHLSVLQECSSFKNKINISVLFWKHASKYQYISLERMWKWKHKASGSYPSERFYMVASTSLSHPCNSHLCFPGVTWFKPIIRGCLQISLP